MIVVLYKVTVYILTTVLLIHYVYKEQKIVVYSDWMKISSN